MNSVFSAALILTSLSLFAGARAEAPAPPAASIPLFKKFTEIYEPVIEAAGGTLIMGVDTSRDSVGGSANRDVENKYVVVLDQGIFKTPRATPDSLILTTCHELGHLLGGLPLRPPPMEWEGPLDSSGNMLLSAEGQADYYATATCFRKIVQDENHQEALKGRKIPPQTVLACDKSWGANSADSLICQRAALGAFEFLNMAKDFPLSFVEPDPNKVDTTIVNGYPGRQCRLDTLLAGALCKETSPLDFQRQDKSACKNGLGARPSCWYKN